MQDAKTKNYTTDSTAVDPGILARDRMIGNQRGADAAAPRTASTGQDETYDPTWTATSMPDGTQPDMSQTAGKDHAEYLAGTASDLDRAAPPAPGPASFQAESTGATAASGAGTSQWERPENRRVDPASEADRSAAPNPPAHSATSATSASTATSATAASTAAKATSAATAETARWEQAHDARARENFARGVESDEFGSSLEETIPEGAAPTKKA